LKGYNGLHNNISGVFWRFLKFGGAWRNLGGAGRGHSTFILAPWSF